MKAPLIERYIHYGARRRGCRLGLLLASALTALPLLASDVEANAPVINDNTITARVLSDLDNSRGLSSHLIDVKCHDGIVTLSGSVSNLLAKERAVRVAESIRGVRGVVDRLETHPQKRTDAAIRRDILTGLLDDPATAPFAIVVRVDHGSVTLEGQVSSWAESQLAANLVKGVAGVRLLDNQIQINYDQPRTDGEIARDVQERLRWDIWVGGDPIDVRVKGQEVTLSGTVGSVFERRRAEEDAWVRGVKTVHARELQIDPELAQNERRPSELGDQSDGQIRQAVLAAFREDPRLKGESPIVTVERGAVILTGSVDRLKTKQAAGQDARDIVGVTVVDNLLRVRPLNTWPEDVDVENALRAALERDPMLLTATIRAAVVDHVAYLSGTVHRQAELEEAHDVAAAIKGVAEIRNRLRLEPETFESRYEGPWYEVETAPAPLKTDAQIERAVEKAFFWSPFVHRNDIHVKVDGGVVVLTGTVGSWVGYNEAYHDAQKSGAVAVVNKLSVKPGAWF